TASKETFPLGKDLFWRLRRSVASVGDDLDPGRRCGATGTSLHDREAAGRRGRSEVRADLRVVADLGAIERVRVDAEPADAATAAAGELRRLTGVAVERVGSCAVAAIAATVAGVAALGSGVVLAAVLAGLVADA